jgi:hypothetical protein
MTSHSQKFGGQDETSPGKPGHNFLRLTGGPDGGLAEFF